MSDDVLAYYDREGKKISMQRWGRLMEDHSYRIVQQEDIGPYAVSTVWLGLDHNYVREGPPIIFETMVFATAERDDPKHKGLHEFDDACWRWPTEAEARQGHSEIMTLIRATLQEEPDMTVPDKHEQENGK